MVERQPSRHDRAEARRYEIRFAGHLDAHWATWFDGLAVSHERDGTTVISGPIADQAALHGLLQRVRDLGLPLVSVTRGETDPPTTLGSGRADVARADSDAGVSGMPASTSITRGR